MITFPTISHSAILNHLPIHYLLSDRNHVYQQTSAHTATIFGLSDPKAIIGKHVSEFFSNVPSMFDFFLNVNKDVFSKKQNIQCISSREYPAGFYTFLSEKVPFYDDKGQLIGVLTTAMELTDINLQRSFFKIFQNDKQHLNKLMPQNCTYRLGDYDLPDLTSRESQCLYYVIRGYTSKEIAKALDISYRTVEYFITQLRKKLNCSTKSQLIEFAHTQNLFSTIPFSCFYEA